MNLFSNFNWVIYRADVRGEAKRKKRSPECLGLIQYQYSTSTVSIQYQFHASWPFFKWNKYLTLKEPNSAVDHAFILWPSECDGPLSDKMVGESTIFGTQYWNYLKKYDGWYCFPYLLVQTMADMHYNVVQMREKWSVFNCFRHVLQSRVKRKLDAAV